MNKLRNQKARKMKRMTNQLKNSKRRVKQRIMKYQMRSRQLIFTKSTD